MNYLMVQPVDGENKIMIVLSNVQFIEPLRNGSSIHFVSGDTLDVTDNTGLMYNTLEIMNRK
jgi:hypothetical protein